MLTVARILTAVYTALYIWADNLNSEQTRIRLAWIKRAKERRCAQTEAAKLAAEVATRRAEHEERTQASDLAAIDQKAWR